MEKVYSRSEPRVLYRAPIWLRSTESGKTIIGETRNLSRKGLFVNVAPTLPLGTELICEIPGHAPIRGRVAWVFDESLAPAKAFTGVGIEIVDLTNEDSSSIVERLVGMRLDDQQPVEIRFAGMPSPIRVTGRVTHEGIDLSTTLGFLKIGSDVTVGPSGDDKQGLRGRISRVSLRTDEDAPRLQISLAVLPEPAPVEVAPDDERWFPEIVVEGAPDSEVAFAPTPLVVEGAFIEPEPTLRTETLVPEPALVPEPTLDPVRVTSAPMLRVPRKPAFGLVGVLALCAGGAAALWLAMPRSTPVEEAKVEVTTVATAADEVAPVVAAPAAAPAPVMNDDEGDEAPLNPNAQPVASAEHPRGEAAQPVAAAPAPVPVPVAAVTPTPAAPAPTAAPKGAWRAQITMVGGAPTVFVPLSGSTKGSNTFTMSDPPGTAIDLPKAHTDVTLKSYLLHDEGFKSLWVRARPAGGLQIRLHVAPGVRVIAEPTDGGIRFRKVAAK